MTVLNLYFKKINGNWQQVELKNFAKNTTFTEGIVFNVGNDYFLYKRVLINLEDEES